jgi:hypothetical protein
MRLESGQRLEPGSLASIEGDAEVSRLVAVCRITGAPMLEALRSLQSARAQAANTAQELLAELAGPQATVKLVTWLPVGVVVLRSVAGRCAQGLCSVNWMTSVLPVSKAASQ